MAGILSRVNRLLRRSNCLVMVSEKTILGFVVWEEGPPVLHMLYVKGVRKFRRWGYGRDLLTATGLQMLDRWYYSQHTGAMVHLARRWGCSYNPLLVE